MSELKNVPAPEVVSGEPPAQPTVDSQSTAQWHASRRRSSLMLHSTFLLVAVGVIAAAGLLHVDANGQIAAPWSSNDSQSLPALCMFRRVFERDCPGCGLTRCFVSAAHGNLKQAWRFHSVGLLLFGIVLVQLPYRTVQIARLLRGKEEYSTIRWAPWLAGAIGVLMIGQWVVRMVV